MKQFYVVVPHRLEEFGFQKSQRSGRWFYQSHRATCVWMDEDSQRLIFQSPSKDCIAVICELYKNGIIEICDDNIEPYFVMKLTEEEMKLVFERRKKNNEQGHRQ